MPPKRKAGGAKGGAGGKKAKTGPATVKDTIKALKEADKGRVKSAKPDALCPKASDVQVYDEYDCMLNQTNVGNNNNKFYIIQVLEDDCNCEYFTWTRWGRVGEQGQNALKGPYDDVDDAIKEFKKKFKDKTKNDWDKRDNFKPAAGKYTLIEIDEDETDADAEDTEKKLAALDEAEGVARVTKDCTLDSETMSLIRLIFDEDMFKESMSKLELDVKKMPLGKLSKTQIAKGFEVLEELENAVKAKKKKALEELTSRFYTLIPHNFGRQRPPIISDQETIRKKMDMLLVLGDIELAQEMLKGKGGTTKSTKEIQHPLDHKFGLLQCGLDLVDKKSKEFKVIDKYMQATGDGDDGLSLLDVWRVDRKGEDIRFGAHKSIKNRKLLWHGTNVAVVAAILKTGLRIMPHSGGRVGRGIYFASEQSKSAGYVGSASDEDGEEIGIMFLNEVALGKEYSITDDDSSLEAAPKGYDSVVARGENEPDPKKDTHLMMDGVKVIVPQGDVIPQPEYEDSSFDQSEYLVYKENQCRIRYLLKIKWY